MAYKYSKKSGRGRSGRKSGYSRSKQRSSGRGRGKGRSGGHQTIRIVVEQPQSMANLPFDANGKLQADKDVKKSKF